jgi:hypothetical protein
MQVGDEASLDQCAQAFITGVDPRKDMVIDDSGKIIL